MGDPAWLDATHAPRAADAVDAEALAAWMHRAVPDELPADAAPLEITQFGSGFSNLTYLVRGGPRELVLRRPPPGVVPGSAHDVAREVRLLSALWPLTAQVPEPVAYCHDPS
ncbi:MAG: phosphotransferase, partial [Gemmatimonadaceae bacterium]|nr:phosphotransferase [Gemmatimonadaceae bacterium]